MVKDSLPLNITREVVKDGFKSKRIIFIESQVSGLETEVTGLEIDSTIPKCSSTTYTAVKYKGEPRRPDGTLSSAQDHFGVRQLDL